VQGRGGRLEFSVIGVSRSLNWVIVAKGSPKSVLKASEMGAAKATHNVKSEESLASEDAMDVSS